MKELKKTARESQNLPGTFAFNINSLKKVAKAYPASEFTFFEYSTQDRIFLYKIHGFEMEVIK